MRVSILGVVVGGVADVLTSFLLGIPLAILASLLTLRAHPGLGAVAAQTTWARMHAHPVIWASEFFVSLLGSGFGGYVAAAIARHDERLNGTLSCWLGITVSILFLTHRLDQDPLWLHAFLMLLGPVMGFVGGTLRFRQRVSRQRAAATA